MNSYSNCSKAGQIGIGQSSLFNFKLCLSPNNDRMTNIKDYGYFEKKKIQQL